VTTQKDSATEKKLCLEGVLNLPLHNLNDEYYVFIWELPLDFAVSVQDLAAKFHARYTEPDYKDYAPPKYRGIYRNPGSANWVIVSAWYCGKPMNGATTPEMFEFIKERFTQFSVYAAGASIPCKMSCMTSGDNYRDYCKYIRDAIEMLEIEYGETGRDALIPIRQNLHRIADYKPNLKIVEGD
tara:strand:- start:1316 stop:1867 length:552 start_codon:yes stop_codon:yes gene_type:complete